MDTVRFNGRNGRSAKVSYVTRRLTEFGFGVGIPLETTADDQRPGDGDLVLCRVAEVGQHQFLSTPSGRKNTLFVDDEVVVAYGGRYAPDQFEAEVPDNLGRCQLAAGGGVAALVVSAHAKMAAPTVLEPVGLVTDGQGAVLNLRQLRRPARPAPVRRPRAIAVLGTSMNAGKTTVAAALVRGLTNAGLRVGAAKVTGTGAPGDPLLFADAGAVEVVDFTDFGYPSTYRLERDAVLGVLRDAVTELTAHDADVVVIEVADGLLQRETAALIKSPEFRETVDSVVLAAVDSIGGLAGLCQLAERNLPVRALSGLLTASPLATAEAAARSGVPVHRSAEFTSPLTAIAVLSAPLPVNPSAAEPLSATVSSPAGRVLSDAVA